MISCSVAALLAGLPGVSVSLPRVAVLGDPVARQPDRSPSQTGRQMASGQLSDAARHGHSLGD